MSSRRCVPRTLVHVLLGTLLSASVVQAQAAAPAERVQYLRVVGQDYAFEAPTTVVEGIVTIHLINQGMDVHQLTVLQMGEGHTIKEFFDAMRSKGQPPAWTVDIGMTPTIQPRAEAFLTVRLVPGRYLISCLIPAKDGRSHVVKGMTTLLTVTRRVAARAP